MACLAQVYIDIKYEFPDQCTHLLVGLHHVFDFVPISGLMHLRTKRPKEDVLLSIQVR